MAPAPVRWGICGTGRMAATIAQELRGLGAAGAELVAVGSRTRSCSEAFAQRFGIPRAYASYADLARDPQLDVVYIATPPSLHAENALACLTARKAVLCEKPFALNAPEAMRMVRTAREQRVFLMEAMWTRFLPALGAVRSIIAAGTLGPLRLVTGGGGFVPHFDPQAPLFNPALGGGVLLDAGVYLVSLASMLLGAPLEVLAQGEIGASGVDEQEAILLRCARGAQALLYVSLKARRSPDFEILGEAGGCASRPRCSGRRNSRSRSATRRRSRPTIRWQARATRHSCWRSWLRSPRADARAPSCRSPRRLE